MPITRRRFITTAAATGAALTAGLSMPRRVRGANEKVRVAVIGVHSRGDNLIHWVNAVGDAKLVALCDVDAKTLAARKADTDKRYGSSLETAADFRAVLDRKDIDAVVIATPNHWHSPMGIMAMQAGKDVYCEKPVSHNVWEGRQLVNAARKFNRIAQTGTQSRCSPGMQKMVDYIRSGELGKVTHIVGTCYKKRGSIGKLDTPLQIPDHIDYDLWCGPAEKRELFRKRVHYDWHWDFNTGNGDLGNQGIHQMDLARWFGGHTALSPRVMSIGGRFGYTDAADTPNTQVVFHDYPVAPIVFEVRGLETKPLHDVSIGVIVYCEGGRLDVGSYSSGRAFDKSGTRIKSFSGDGDHMGNFIACVKSRRREDLFAEIEQGHLSSALCHTGNISYRLGKLAAKGEVLEQIRSNPAAEESAGRFFVHCAERGVKVDDKTVTLGPWLQMDPATERFIDNDAANAMLSRKYRAPFIVPDLSA